MAAPLTTGISDSYSPEAQAFQHVRDTGSTIALGPLRWNVVAPEKEPAHWDPSNPADPHYEWAFFDEWVRNAVAAGLTPVLQLRGAPKWAEGCTPTAESEAVCDPDPVAFEAFAHAAAVRYGGGFEGLPRVRYWEGMNEPNLSIYFQPQFEGGKLVSVGLYRRILEGFSRAVRQVHPNNRIVAPSLGPIAVPGYTIGPMEFTRRLLCMKGSAHPKPTKGNCGGPLHFDIFDIHPYTTGRPDHKGGHNDVEMGDLGKLQRLIAAADRAGRIKSATKHTPLWVTEFAYDSKPPDPGGLTMKIEKQWVAEALYQAWLAKVQTFMWYSLDDQEPNPSLPFSVTLQSGLYFWAKHPAEEKPKPAVAAYRFPVVAIREGSGLSYWGKTPTGSSGPVSLQAQKGGAWRQIAKVSATAGGIFHGRLKTGYGASARGAVRAVFDEEASPGFPMHRVPDFIHQPFG